MAGFALIGARGSGARRHPLPPGAGQSALVGERPVHRAPRTWRARRRVVSAIVDPLPKFPRGVQELGSSGPRNCAMSRATRGAGTQGHGRAGLGAAFSWRWAESRWLTSEEGQPRWDTSPPLIGKPSVRFSTSRLGGLRTPGSWSAVGDRWTMKTQRLPGFSHNARIVRCPRRRSGPIRMRCYWCRHSGVGSPTLHRNPRAELSPRW